MHGLMLLWFTDLMNITEEVNMRSFQTKALVVTPISGNNFTLVPPNCMVS